eukprot:TRINITY_DN30943_c0_g1_i2.p1 TRINITY_DN30943_c0_g1~~TRINITY_DN30943_c0_g1_i2.p1  ORF type:complete len:209 (+),score=45.86 TRINITY_DN30943_c0_g1_i2:248-874(+)
MMMLAVYPPGEGVGFREHLDNPKGDGRVVTAVYYLNPGWRAEDGGLLRAWTDGDTSAGEALEITPEADRLVLFRSERIRHEVTPNKKQGNCFDAHRCALTMWFFCEEEAVSYLERNAAVAAAKLSQPQRNPQQTEKHALDANENEMQKDERKETCHTKAKMVRDGQQHKIKLSDGGGSCGEVNDDSVRGGAAVADLAVSEESTAKKRR